MIRKNDIKHFARGFRDEFTNAITGDGLRQAKKTRNRAKEVHKLALKAQKSNMKSPSKPITHNIANEQKMQILKEQTEKQLQNQVDLFKQHGNQDVFDAARKSIMDTYNKKAAKLGKNGSKRTDFANRVVDSANYHNSNRIAQNNVDESKKLLDKANAMLNAQRIKTHGTRITLLAGIKALNDKTYGKMLEKQKQEQRQKRQDRLTELQIRELRAKDKERKAMNKKAFDYIDDLVMEKQAIAFSGKKLRDLDKNPKAQREEVYKYMQNLSPEELNRFNMLANYNRTKKYDRRDTIKDAVGNALIYPAAGITAGVLGNSAMNSAFEGEGKKALVKGLGGTGVALTGAGLALTGVGATVGKHVRARRNAERDAMRQMKAEKKHKKEAFDLLDEMYMEKMASLTNTPRLYY